MNPHCVMCGCMVVHVCVAGNGKEVAIRTGLRFVNKSWRDIVAKIQAIVGKAPAPVLVYCWRYVWTDDSVNGTPYAF